MIAYNLAKSVNTEVNSGTTPMTDKSQYGVDEYFEFAVKGGYEDCDGFALSKRQKLIELGVSYDDYFLVRCKIPEGGHLVLAVNTDKGWFILDNLHDFPMSPSSLGYEWVSALRDGVWVEFSFTS